MTTGAMTHVTVCNYIVPYFLLTIPITFFIINHLMQKVSSVFSQSIKTSLL